MELTTVQAKFEWAIGLPGNLSLSPTGKMSLFVGKLLISVPNAIITSRRLVTAPMARRA